MKPNNFSNPFTNPIFPFLIFKVNGKETKGKRETFFAKDIHHSHIAVFFPSLLPFIHPGKSVGVWVCNS
jgi:hypothetical protein